MEWVRTNLEKLYNYMSAFFKEKPEYVGLFIALVGALILFSAIMGHEWVFEGPGTSDLVWIRKNFGKNAARYIYIFMSSFLIIIGILIFFLWR